MMSDPKVQIFDPEVSSKYVCSFTCGLTNSLNRISVFRRTLIVNVGRRTSEG